MKQEQIMQELVLLTELARFYVADGSQDARIYREIYRGFETLSEQAMPNRHMWRTLLEILWPQLAWTRPDLIIPSLFPVFVTAICEDEEVCGRIVPQVKLDLLPIAA